MDAVLIFFLHLTEFTCCVLWIGQAKNALVETFLFLDQIVWAGRTGIYKVWCFFANVMLLSPVFDVWRGCLWYCLVLQDTERLNLISRISLFCWMAGTSCTTVVEVSWLWKYSLVTQAWVTSFLCYFSIVILGHAVGIVLILLQFRVCQASCLWPMVCPLKLFALSSLRFLYFADVWRMLQGLKVWMLIKVQVFCLQAAEITRLGTATKKVERELKRAKGTGSIEELKLVS
jgi:hypothetical protein